MSVKKEVQTPFSQAYAKLNPEQRQAVDTIEGPLMVFAGPGTGKTQIMAVRIANILQQTDVLPHNILALTFTDSGVHALQERLLQLIGQQAYGVEVTTFHSFCSNVVQKHGEYFTQFGYGAQPLSDLERFEIVESILTDGKLDILRPLNAPTFYTKACVSALQNLKREGVTPEKLQQVVEQELQDIEQEKEELSKTELSKRSKSAQKQKELVEVYTLYQKKLAAQHRYDFEDMIMSVVEAFSQHEDLLLIYQERFQYFVVDEYQDTNSAQFKVLQLMASFWGDNANVCVVGDISQSLYRFQGASTENALAFLKAYPGAKVLTLKQNYRSGQGLLDAAANLIERNKEHEKNEKLAYVSDPLVALADSSKANIHVHQYTSEFMEYIDLGERIQTLIKQGILPKHIAVLYRNNAQADLLCQVFTAMNISYVQNKERDALQNVVVQQLLTLCWVILGWQEHTQDMLFTVMNYAWTNLDSVDVAKLTRAAQLKKITLFELLNDKSWEKEKNKYVLRDASAIERFVQHLSEWAQTESQRTLPEWIEQVTVESGFLDWVLHRPTAPEDLNALHTLFTTMEVWAKQTKLPHRFGLAEFLKRIQTLQNHGLSVTYSNLNSPDSVTLSTAHSAKGLEWEYVFIIGALDNSWGNVRTRELLPLPQRLFLQFDTTEHDDNEDERRVFYVALTRAKKEVHISYAGKTVSDLGKPKERLPSMFVLELPEKNVVSQQHVFTAEKMQKSLELLVKPPVQPILTLREKEWLTEVLDTFILTPTALNTYLQCPYKFKLSHLLKVPRAKKEYLAFGSAVHRALELFAKEYQQKNVLPSCDFLLQSFSKALEQELFTQQEFEVRLQHGLSILKAYYEAHKHDFFEPLYIEKYFGYTSPVVVGGARIGGKIDLVSWQDKKKNQVVVIDYKTGQPKSRNEIEGKTGSGTGEYKRQLVFYKLLAELDRTFTAKVAEGALEFIEPSKPSGTFKREVFALDDTEMQDLTELIRKTAEEMRTLLFPRTTDTSICHNCDFKHHCYPEGLPPVSTQQLALL